MKSSMPAQRYKKKGWPRNLTPLLPIKSAIVPLTSAPTIPPAVNIEPKTENCTVRLREKARK